MGVIYVVGYNWFQELICHVQITFAPKHLLQKVKNEKEGLIKLFRLAISLG